MRKLWNPKHFKAHVSPHEMLQSVVLVSKKKFQITQQGDAVDFLNFLIGISETVYLKPEFVRGQDIMT